MSIAQTRRANDFRLVRELAAAHPGALRIVRTEGAPPSRYLIEIGCRTMVALDGDAPTLGDRHTVRIDLDATYPLTKPRATVLTPLVNPHVFPSGSVCVGEIAWNPGESLDLFVRRLRSILVWDPVGVNLDSPANGEAMQWHRRHPERAPFDAPQFGGAAPDAPGPAKPAIRFR